MNDLGQQHYSAFSQRPQRNSVINDTQRESVNTVRLETGATAYQFLPQITPLLSMRAEQRKERL
jgi:hypothetical protein